MIETQKKLFDKGPFAVSSIIAALLYGVPQIDRKRIRKRYVTKLKVCPLTCPRGHSFPATAHRMTSQSAESRNLNQGGR